MLKNKDLLDKYKVEVCGRANKDGSKDVEQTGKIKKLYFDKMSDQAALQQMVQDRFFGMDCIGFIANFLIFTGEWDKYYGVSPRRYPDHVAKTNIDDINEVKPLDFMVWNGHVAMIDWVWEVLDEKRAYRHVPELQRWSAMQRIRDPAPYRWQGSKGRLRIHDRRRHPGPTCAWPFHHLAAGRVLVLSTKVHWRDRFMLSPAAPFRIARQIRDGLSCAKASCR